MLVGIAGLLIADSQQPQKHKEMGPLSGPESWKDPYTRLQNIGAFTPDDDRLNAAASRAGFDIEISSEAQPSRPGSSP